MNREIRTFTTPKIVDTSPTEDSILACERFLAVSDGAGGCGIFAKEWSEYLLNNLPNEPFADFIAFSTWTDSIWEAFYTAQNAKIEPSNHIVLNKFNNEGSFATLVVAWLSDNHIDWCCYGDSALFVVNAKSGVMKFMTAPDVQTYDTNPMLVNWKDVPKEAGYRHGNVELEKDDVILLASDALACYITMAYYVYIGNKQEGISPNGKLSMVASSVEEHVKELRQNNFYEDCLVPLISGDGAEDFRGHIAKLHEKGVIVNDDYSLVVWKSLCE